MMWFVAGLGNNGLAVCLSPTALLNHGLFVHPTTGTYQATETYNQRIVKTNQALTKQVMLAHLSDDSWFVKQTMVAINHGLA